MTEECKVTQWMVDQLVKPEHQYQEIVSSPLDHVRMAWPFKTEAELLVLSKWFKQEEKKLKKKQIKEHIEQYGEALL